MNSRININPERPNYPTPAGLITSLGPDGVANIVTLGEVFNISIVKPVIVGISIRKATHTHRLIRERGEFVINHPTSKLVRHIHRIGSVSGREVDKFADTGLTAIPAAHVAPPLIAECPVNVECRVMEITEVGDHDLIKGEVLAVHADPSVTTDGEIDYRKLDPVILMLNAGGGIEYYRLGERIATD